MGLFNIFYVCIKTTFSFTTLRKDTGDSETVTTSSFKDEAVIVKNSIADRRKYTILPTATDISKIVSPRNIGLQPNLRINALINEASLSLLIPTAYKT